MRPTPQPIRAATMFSGIGAPECAMPEWDWAWSAEIEAFPSAVLAARHPQSVNLGDVTAPDFLDRAMAMGPINVLVGGPPCQAFSVAGLRGSLSDPRGNLSLQWVQAIHAIGPDWAVTENVPGWLGTDDNAFGCFLAGLVGADAPLCAPNDGGRWPSAGLVAGPLARAAWRVLDAQYFGLAQRRARVFVVAGLRDWTDPAQVLFERKGVCRHFETRGEAREGIARPLAAGSPGGSRYRNDADTAENLIAGTIGSDHGNVRADQAWTGRLISSSGERECALTSSNQRIDYETETLIAHALRAGGFDASEDGTGRGTPLVATFDPTQVTSKANRSRPHPELCHTMSRDGYAPVAYALGSHAGAADGDQTNRSHDSGGPVGMGISEEVSHSLRGGRTQAVALSASDYESGAYEQVEQSSPLTTSADRTRSAPVVTVALRGREGGGTAELGGEVATAIRASQGGGDKPHVLHAGVRRLTPLECEKLQGLPKGHTAIPYRGEIAKDGPRYKAIGNSLAVPVMRWILERVEAQSRAERADALAEQIA